MRRATARMMPHPAHGDNELVRIRAARVTELPFLQAIDRGAGQMFGDIGMPEIAEHHRWPLPVLAARQDAGRLWVAADQTDEPVAFLMAEVVDGRLQVEQATVHSGSSRRGLGRRLLEHAASRAAADGLAALTLTTFAHVPSGRAVRRPVRIPGP